MVMYKTIHKSKRCEKYTFNHENVMQRNCSTCYNILYELYYNLQGNYDLLKLKIKFRNLVINRIIKCIIQLGCVSFKSGRRVFKL